MGHGRKFRAKLRATAPLIRARSLRIQNGRADANEIASESKIMRYEVRCFCANKSGSSEDSFRDGQRNCATRRDFSDESAVRRKCGITKSYFSVHFKWAVL